jgi:hypothetical protein
MAPWAAFNLRGANLYLPHGSPASDWTPPERCGRAGHMQACHTSTSTGRVATPPNLDFPTAPPRLAGEVRWCVVCAWIGGASPLSYQKGWPHSLRRTRWVKSLMHTLHCRSLSPSASSTAVNALLDVVASASAVCVSSTPSRAISFETCKT